MTGMNFAPVRVGVVGLGRFGKLHSLTIAGAEGEIPFDFQPGETHPFAVLYGPEGQYATLDYGSHPAGYIGWQVSLDEIGLAGFVRPRKTPNASQPGMSVVRSVPGH